MGIAWRRLAAAVAAALVLGGGLAAAIGEDCSKIPNCAECGFARVDGRTRLLCSVCTGHTQLSGDQLSCECQPGWWRPKAGAACAECGVGAYCEGGAAQEGRNACGAGLTTVITTAARAEQCVTLAGWGVPPTAAAAALCERGYYNSGGTRNPCRPCGGGLMTADRGAASFEACLAPPGYFYSRQTAWPCPTGTFQPFLGRIARCTPCPAGLTTAESGSTSSNDCKLPRQGGPAGEAGASVAAVVAAALPCQAGGGPCRRPLGLDEERSGGGGGGAAASELEAAALGRIVKTASALLGGSTGGSTAGAGAPSQPTCPANTYHVLSGPCQPCNPPGYQCAPNSSVADDCVQPWDRPVASVDTIPVDYRPAAGYAAPALRAASPADCRAVCAASRDCMFYTWNKTAAARGGGAPCQLLHAVAAAGADAVLAFKNDITRYTVWGWRASRTALGAPLAPPASKASMEACMAACDRIEECIAAMFAPTRAADPRSGGVCRLLGGALHPDISMCEVKADGPRMVNVQPSWVGDEDYGDA